MASGDPRPENHLTEPDPEPLIRNTKHETWRFLEWPLLLSHQVSTEKLSVVYRDHVSDSQPLSGGCSFRPDIRARFRLESIAMDTICTRVLEMDRLLKSPVAVKWVVDSRRLDTLFNEFV